ncbi:hypothetical protein G6F56_010597 [Rhizopus delemar]|uniref:Uncharacterized protein n=1 Tax=Rhizopus stolonifer TaxID=4846 RepID=A0A367IML8_RHIST|nr:hypothetical protein G6F56_010597 [Rhizopus delemar]RCH78914.1 hypothetical protein CU098_003157 [Rhizopus stolonifer]
MPVRKQSPYGPFVEYVVLPAIRIGLLFLSIIAIGFGSWLETNDQIDQCSFKSTVSLHQVFLFRNITNNMTTPDSVSFGLWKHCYIYSHNCTCSPTNLRYQPDVSTILQVAATTHNAIAPVSTSTSLSRILPLTLATLFGSTAFLLGLYTNKRGKYIYRRMTVGLIAATTLLVTYTFGYSYQRYFQMIKETCASPDNDVYCARHTLQSEVVIFGIALACLAFALLFWISASSFLSKGNDDSVARTTDPEPIQRRLTPMNHPLPLQEDELAVWRDIALFDFEQSGLGEEKKYGEKKRMSRLPESALSPPPPLKHRQSTRDPKRYSRKESNDLAMRRTSTDWEQRFHVSQTSFVGGAKKTPTRMSPYCMTPQMDDDSYFSHHRRKSSNSQLGRSNNKVLDKRIQDYFQNTH